MNTSVNIDISGILKLIIKVVGRYKLNEKAGKEGWLALIPFYSTYLLYKYADRAKSYFIALITTIIGSVSVLMSIFFFAMKYYIEFYGTADFTTAIDAGEIDPAVINEISRNESLARFFGICAAVGIVCLLIAMVVHYKKCKGLAENFGASKAMKWGLFFLDDIFVLILAFDQKYAYKADSYNNEEVESYSDTFYNDRFM